MNNQLFLKLISAQETIEVRQPVLRVGRPVKDCIFEGDTANSTLHIGAFYDNTLVGVVTYMHNPNSIFKGNKQYQLRGMAVLAHFQKKGIGKLLIEKGEHLLKQKKASLIWCNARVNAVPFYEKNGYCISGNLFDIPTVGPHYMMYKKW
ncbi:GNAT family N-acetyltransferase [Aquimarina agarivorans]|uniref:GNAT family N-acetyltransferase n=1 Tax=Aquimarina agarivorans TaxID=980584 RepID=UPI000248EF7E|nr:GNAT family N-acetyltransferase [Aquimarina agarivorans]